MCLSWTFAQLVLSVVLLTVLFAPSSLSLSLLLLLYSQFPFDEEQIRRTLLAARDPCGPQMKVLFPIAMAAP